MHDYYLLLWYQFASIYFMSNDLDNALKWVNAIVNRRFKVDRKDLENYARILNLMIHFELGNTFLLKYMVENSRRWMKKQQTLKPLERALLKFFGKLSHAPKGDYSIHFQQLHNTLFDEVNPLVNANILDYLDFRQWIGQYLKRNPILHS